jgi:uncharacterized protein (TIGR03067 family)
MQRILFICLIVIFTPVAARAAEDAAGLKQFRGRWRITELTDNGSFISPERIKNWLPSGGQIEFVDNTLQFTSTLDGSKTAKTFAIDATVYPFRMVLATRGKNEGWGVYRFDQSRLIVCLSNPAVAPAPTDFAAPKGSNRMLMVLERDNSAPAPRQTVGTPTTIPPPAADQLKPLPSQPPPPPPTPPATPATPPPAPPVVAAKVLTDAQVATALYGRWQFNDGIGLINVTLEPNGRFNSTREVQNATTFHSVFTKTPVSSGTWSVNGGQLLLRVTASIYVDRANRVIPLTVRSVSATDLIFVDYLGRLGRGVKLP